MASVYPASTDSDETAFLHSNRSARCRTLFVIIRPDHDTRRLSRPMSNTATATARVIRCECDFRDLWRIPRIIIDT